MLSNPFPDSCTFFSSPLAETLSLSPLPEEQAFIQNFKSESRKRNYLVGRHLSRKALAEFDPSLSLYFIGTGPQNEPLWPKGFIGSISHSNSYACSIVSQQNNTLAVGIDIEPLDRILGQDISGRICDNTERAWVKENPNQETQRLLTVFAAKEAVFKALFPLYQEMFWFDAVSLSWDSAQRRFDAKLLFEPSSFLPEGSVLPIQIMFEQGHVVASIIVPQATLNNDG
ncbi:MAG: 4'-phosphopantetheinyl transferase superfamily protein [Bdellovibrionales bacterium]|nr:4'-phosphopantetheinyl transferase superfamily protein [Bdellovibrionales bacterium]